MSKVTKNERISTLEDAVAMNWSDMKKIETKISRAMTDMATRISNISLQLEGQQRQIHLAADSIGLNKQAIIMLENEREAEPEPEPQLKQLDQSVFDGLDEKWRFAAVDKGGEVWVYSGKPDRDCGYWFVKEPVGMSIGRGYDASNWQNSLIERDDIAKELLEVDLSSELTGSELCQVMIARGATMVMCAVSNSHDQNCAVTKHHEIDIIHDLGSFVSSTHPYIGFQNNYRYATPINNQGEPLTASEVGL